MGRGRQKKTSRKRSRPVRKNRNKSERDKTRYNKAYLKCNEYKTSGCEALEQIIIMLEIRGLG